MGTRVRSNADFGHGPPITLPSRKQYTTLVTRSLLMFVLHGVGFFHAPRACANKTRAAGD